MCVCDEFLICSVRHTLNVTNLLILLLVGFYCLFGFYAFYYVSLSFSFSSFDPFLIVRSIHLHSFVCFLVCVGIRMSEQRKIREGK